MDSDGRPSPVGPGGRGFASRVDAASEELTRQFESALEGFRAITGWLWWLAVTFFGMGDLLTTGFATTTAAVVEGSPLVTAALSTHGVGGLVALKVLTFGAAYVAWRSLPEPHDVGVPLALAVLGVGLTTWNMFVIGFVFAG